MSGTRQLRPVDGHVHFHSLTRVEATLDAACANFSALAGSGAAAGGALLLAQSAGDSVFESLRERSRAGSWSLDPVAGEPETVIACKDDRTVAVICGRQVRTHDGLEVLALGTCRAFTDGMDFRSTLDAVRDSEALAVVPWSFGKWWGRRGRQVDAALASAGHGSVFIGDNGSRLAAAGVPRSVRRVERRGFRVLPGTDPFPFRHDLRRVGSFGFLADFALDGPRPWRGLREWLVCLQRSPEIYGRASGMVRFALNQVGIQLRNALPQGRTA